MLGTQQVKSGLLHRTPRLQLARSFWFLRPRGRMSRQGRHVVSYAARLEARKKIRMTSAEGSKEPVKV